MQNLETTVLEIKSKLTKDLLKYNDFRNSSLFRLNKVRKLIDEKILDLNLRRNN